MNVKHCTATDGRAMLQPHGHKWPCKEATARPLVAVQTMNCTATCGRAVQEEGCPTSSRRELQRARMELKAARDAAARGETLEEAANRRREMAAEYFRQQQQIQQEEHLDIHQQEEERDERQEGENEQLPLETDVDHTPELLDMFESHVAKNIWNGVERKVMKMICHTKKLLEWDCRTRNPDWWAYVRSGGLHTVRDLSYKKPNKNLIFAFVERWHPETNTFHMPFGEMTITLDDVSCLLGLTIVGHPVLSSRTEKVDAIAEVIKHFGISNDRARKATEGQRGSGISLDWLLEFNDQISSRDDTEVQIAACAYLLYVFGTALFANKSGDRISASWLDFLVDMNRVDSYAWGAAVLAYLYRSLGDAAKFSTRQMTGFTTLLEAWIYEHFPSIIRPQRNPDYRHGDPLALKWSPVDHRSASIADIQAFRGMIDSLQANEVTWDPYTLVRNSFPRHEVVFCHCSLSAGDIIEPYMPDRVLRQFGHVQTIPWEPLGQRVRRGAIATADASTGWRATAQQFAHWGSHLLTMRDRGRLASYAWECSDDYLPWYHINGRPHIQNPRVRDELPAHVPLVDGEERLRYSASLLAPYVHRWHGGEAIHSSELASVLIRTYEYIVDDGTNSADPAPSRDRPRTRGGRPRPRGGRN